MRISAPSKSDAAKGGSGVPVAAAMRAGGDPTGDPNMTPTGERIEKDNPNYREGFEDFKAPDHRSAEEKEADPHGTKPKDRER